MSRSEEDKDPVFGESHSIGEVHSIMERRASRSADRDSAKLLPHPSFHIDLLTRRRARMVAHDVGATPLDVVVRIPSQLRGTLNLLLDLAEEKETRAKILISMHESRETDPASAATIRGLQRTAAELHDLALRLLKEHWLERS